VPCRPGGWLVVMVTRPGSGKLALSHGPQAEWKVWREVDEGTMLLLAANPLLLHLRCPGVVVLPFLSLLLWLHSSLNVETRSPPLCVRPKNSKDAQPRGCGILCLPPQTIALNHSVVCTLPVMRGRVSFGLTDMMTGRSGTTLCMSAMIARTARP
jgi:hypothetical protein